MPETPHGDAWRRPEIARKYLAGVRAAIPLGDEQIDVMLRLIAASGEAPERILDLGCGDGVLAAQIVDRWPGISVDLADFSEPMLEAARERFGDTTAKVRFLSCDYGRANWPDDLASPGSYDAVVSGFSIHHQPDASKRRIYSDIFELLRPGGVFVNIEHVSSPSPWLGKLHDERFVDELERSHQAQGGGKSRDELAREYYFRDDKSDNILAPAEVQCSWLRRIGFEDVDCFVKLFELAVIGGRKPPGANGL